MMGNLRSVMMTLLIIGMVSVGITGCMRDTVGPVDDNDNLVSATLPDPDMSGSTYEEASIEVEMRIKVPAASVRRLMFGDVLRRMRLDSSQAGQVKTLLSSHEDCVRSAITALRDSEKAILDSAKAARQVIIDSLTAGSIDTATARERMRALNDSTTRALINNPAVAVAWEALKACRDEFFTAFRAILTERQLKLLDEWLSDRGGHPVKPRCNQGDDDDDDQGDDDDGHHHDDDHHHGHGNGHKKHGG